MPPSIGLNRRHILQVILIFSSLNGIKNPIMRIGVNDQVMHKCNNLVNNEGSRQTMVYLFGLP